MQKRNVLGRKIKEMRKKKGITQEQLTARLNIQGIEIDQSRVSKIESQIRPIFDYQIEGFAKALGVSIEELFNK
ncbi:MAG: helix-turn-helix domain-containing protein [Bacillota bacterium]